MIAKNPFLDSSHYPEVDSERKYRLHMATRKTISPSLRAVLAANFSALMATEPEMTMAALALRLDIGYGTLYRIKTGEVGCSIDMLDAISGHYKIEPWMLLVPGLTPGHVPRLLARAPAQGRKVTA